MALYFTVGKEEHCAYVGDGAINQYAESCNTLQADGHELDEIRSQFSGIPMTTNRIVNWTGEIARFIFDNLKL